MLDVGAGRFGDPQPVQRQQGDQRVLGRRAEPGGDQQGAELVAVRPDGVRLVIDPRLPDMGGRGVIQEFFLHCVAVEPGDGAQAAGDGRPGPASCFQVAGEALRADSARLLGDCPRTASAPGAGVVTIGTVLRPEVRYARADDGVAIAYSVVGDGPVTIAVVSPLISQLELAWEEPALEHFWSRFAACARVVLFDRRGAGLSDRSPADERLDLAALALDIGAVLNACDAGQAALLGVTFGCPVAIGFAAGHPDRVQALVLAGGFAKLTRLGEFDFAANPGLVDEWASSTARAWGSGAVFGARAPSLRDSARYREWAARMERHTCSPGSVEALCRCAAAVDVRPLLADLRMPVLVIHRRGDHAVPASDGRYLAEHIPGAEYAELPGEDHTLFVGDQRAVHKTVIGFLDRAVAGGAMSAALRRAARKDAAGSGWDALTPSEREVAALIASGLTNSQVASRLRMSPHTVDGRLRRVFAKLGVNTRVELTAEYARVTG